MKIQNYKARLRESGGVAGDPLARALLRLKGNNTPSVYATAVATLDKVLGNIASNPLEDKYRRVKRQNAAFRKRLGGLTGGHDCMLATGFVVERQEAGGEEVYQLHASAEKWNLLTRARAVVGVASEDAKREQQRAARPPSGFGANANSNNATGGTMGGAMGGGFPAPDMRDPMVQNMVSEVMRNPAALGNVLQSPMFSEMLRNDPNVSPMMRQYMESMRNNPAAMEQMMTQMRDPAVMENFRREMETRGAGMSGGFAPPGSHPAAGGHSTNTTGTGSAAAAAPPPQPQNDPDTTEDEMIAEAIRRSLQEN